MIFFFYLCIIFFSFAECCLRNLHDVQPVCILKFSQYYWEQSKFSVFRACEKKISALAVHVSLTIKRKFFNILYNVCFLFWHLFQKFRRFLIKTLVFRGKKTRITLKIKKKVCFCKYARYCDENAEDFANSKTYCSVNVTNRFHYLLFSVYLKYFNFSH